MRIKKVSQPTPIIPGTAQISDTYSASTTDGYSCNYVNTQCNEMIVDYTAPADTNTIELTGLNIQPGEYYKFRIVGCATSRADIRLTFNNITTAQYYQAGFYNDGTGTSSNVDLSKNAGYRPGQQYFYYGLSFDTNPTQIDGIIAIRKNLANNNNFAYFEWNSRTIWSGRQNLATVCGAYGATSVSSITSLKLTNVTFKAGTRIQIIKVNNDFTI